MWIIRVARMSLMRSTWISAVSLNVPMVPTTTFHRLACPAVLRSQAVTCAQTVHTAPIASTHQLDFPSLTTLALAVAWSTPTAWNANISSASAALKIWAWLMEDSDAPASWAIMFLVSALRPLDALKPYMTIRGLLSAWNATPASSMKLPLMTSAFACKGLW
jgi:hypothetical protein